MKGLRSYRKILSFHLRSKQKDLRVAGEQLAQVLALRRRLEQEREEIEEGQRRRRHRGEFRLDFDTLRGLAWLEQALRTAGEHLVTVRAVEETARDAVREARQHEHALERLILRLEDRHRYQRERHEQRENDDLAGRVLSGPSVWPGVES